MSGVDERLDSWKALRNSLVAIPNEAIARCYPSPSLLALQSP
jgi:hypothetical protein